MKRIGHFGLLAALVFLLSTPGPLRAQNASSGTIIGTVTDSSGAVVVGSSVILRDLASNATRTTTTNGAGRYSFVGVIPGSFSLTAAAKGFKQVQAPAVTVEVDHSYTVNLKLEVGEASETVEVNETAAAELQTMDSTVGSTLGGDTLLALPTQTRDATSLMLLQPASMPQQGPSQSSTLGGQVAGAASDQNTITLDGGNDTNPTSGNTDYFSGFDGAPQGSIPTPVESLQEFKVATNNPDASFSGGSGSQVMLVTKRGTNTYHGSAYWYLQNDVLNANTWNLNRLNETKPVGKDNRIGGSLGGFIPGLPKRERTYFYVNWEGRWNSNDQTITRLVPTANMRNGILTFADATGAINTYNLATSTACGTAGTTACDPRMLGLDPDVSQIWSKYEPVGNNSASGDGLNTVGYTQPTPFPINDEFVVVRLDHSFGANWQAFTTYRYFSESAASTHQVDIGGFVSGDTLGAPKSVATIPREPRYLVVGLTGQMTPTMTQQIHFDYLRDWWNWSGVGAPPQLPGLPAALEIGGETSNAFIPLNIDTGDMRMRTWLDHNWVASDDISWLRGNHLITFGGSLNFNNVQFDRNDGQTGSSTYPVYQLTSSGSGGAAINFTSANRPSACSSSVTTHCLPSAQNTTWATDYASVTGMVAVGTVLGTRSGSFQPNPPGTYLYDNDSYEDPSLYLNDSWHMLHSLTLNFGVNWSLDMPPTEANGTQALAVIAATNAVVTPTAYLASREAAAAQGQVYNPVLGFEPIAKTGLKYPWAPDYHDFSPRIAIAWNPDMGKGGWMGWLFGGNQTVLRGGYARLYQRLIGEQKVINGIQGLGFGQTLTCIDPSSGGACLGASGANPANSFRIGVDGTTVPIPALSSAPAPLIPGNVPGSNSSLAPTTYQMDPNYTPGPNDEFDLTLQRAFNQNLTMELGYIGRKATKIYMPLQLNQVPYMMTEGGQSFAQAWNNVASALASGATPSAQPWLETALAGSSLCTTSCTAGVVSKYSADFTNQSVQTLWNAIQPSFTMGNVTASTSQVTSLFFWSNQGDSNYNAGFVAFHLRNLRGLTLDSNLTWSHAMGNANLNEDDDTATSNSFDPHYDYGTLPYDRRLVLNILGNYKLPFGQGSKSLVGDLVRNWSVAPIFSAYSGLPINVSTGSSQEYGQTSANGADAILIQPDAFGNTLQRASSATGTVSTNENSASGGTGLNLFANPAAVYASFRPAELGVDTTSRGGQITGMGHWNVDLSLARKLQVTEGLSATFSAQMFNVFNHVQFSDPSMSLQNPAAFGVVTGVLNNPRAIELGLHIDF